MALEKKEMAGYIGFFVPKPLKKLAENRAKSENRSLSNYLVNLLEGELKHGKNPKIGS